jgi:transcriptional regulator of heat shock response
MAYDRVIPIVDITSKLLSGALSSWDYPLYFWALNQ